MTILDRIRVPFFFVLMAVYAVFSPSKACQLSQRVLDV